MAGPVTLGSDPADRQFAGSNGLGQLTLAFATRLNLVGRKKRLGTAGATLKLAVLAMTSLPGDSIGQRHCPFSISDDRGNITSKESSVTTAISRTLIGREIFLGVVFLPSYWIVDDSIGAVARYQYQGSEEWQGIRLNSRYVRRAGSRDNLPTLANGRGDKHHSVYMGMNKLICSHQHKIMAGVEFDSLRQSGNEVFQGWTVMAAYRMYW